MQKFERILHCGYTISCLLKPYNLSTRFFMKTKFSNDKQEYRNSTLNVVEFSSISNTSHLKYATTNDTKKQQDTQSFVTLLRNSNLIDVSSEFILKYKKFAIFAGVFVRASAIYIACFFMGISILYVSIN